MQMRGLAVGRSCFVAWSGKAAKVYRVDMQLQRFEQLDAVQTAGTAMAIADASHVIDEVWFVAEQSVVKILNFSGTVRGTITFSEGEGTPQYLDINGKYLAIVTNKGVIKIIDVHAPTKPKQLGSAGQFFTTTSSSTSNSSGSAAAGGAGKSLKIKDSKGSATAMDELASAMGYLAPAGSGSNADNTKIRRIRVNSSGTMVAILTGKEEFYVLLFVDEHIAYV